MNKIKKFRKVKKVESYNLHGCLNESKQSHAILILTAIPWLGALLILIYYLTRRTEETYYEEIKDE